MQSVDARMHGMSDWMQGMDLRLQSIDASIQMMISWMRPMQSGDGIATSYSDGLGDDVPLMFP